MSKHTPGPWQRSGIRQKLGDEDCIRVGPDGFAIAFLPIGRRPQEQAGALADAHLIAASPDLLEALRDAVACLGGISSANVPESVRAAIAKAEGA
jgi:hypothetical protein